MLPITGNLTNGTNHLLYKCLEFLTTLTSVNRSQTQVTFKTNKGTEFIKVDGFRHYPILVSEALFKFLTALGTAGLIILFVVCTTLWLCYCDHLIRYFVHSWKECDLRLARQARAAAERSNIIVYSRNQNPDPITNSTPTTPYITFAGAGSPVESTFVKRYLKEPVVTIDGKFVVQAFEKAGRRNEIGIHLQIQPKLRCTRLNCDRLRCPKQHIFYISIGCNHTFHPQLEINYPTRHFSTDPPEVDEIAIV